VRRLLTARCANGTVRPKQLPACRLVYGRPSPATAELLVFYGLVVVAAIPVNDNDDVDDRKAWRCARVSTQLYGHAAGEHSDD